MQRVTNASLTRAALSGAIASLFTAAAVATPDRIYLSDGSILQDVTVVTEGLTEVSYKPSGSKKATTVESELVLSVEFSGKPEEVSLADVDASQEGFGSALAGMQNYLENLGGKKEKKFGWAPTYARYRIVELNALMNDVPALVAAVDDLLAKDGDSRYAPIAMSDKIQALITNGDLAAAKEATTAFKEMVSAKSLPKRWQFEQQLLELRSNASKSGADLEKELKALAKAAAVFPTVTNAADVATAQSLLSRSEFAEAEELFRGVTEDTNADDTTIAAAWTGLGDCLYRRAEAKKTSNEDEANELFSQAQLAFMRTVVNYRFEYAYVAQSAFYAGRCFQEMGGENAKENSSKLFLFVIRNFRGSKWAESAKEFQRRN